MEEYKPLHLGAAYHGNRMLNHAYDDLKDMAMNGMDTVVHMLSHTDWERHLNVMKQMVEMSYDLGLDVFMDNWGIGGSPGDKSHVLGLYPDAHMVYSDGTLDPTQACVNNPNYRKFVKEWIDAVEFTGAKKLFWDEPHLPTKKDGDGKLIHCCCCKICRGLFREKYGREMPLIADKDTAEFGANSITDFFAEMTEYAHNKGMVNSVCVMYGTYGMSLDDMVKLCKLPYMDNLGSDPYWISRKKKDPNFSTYKFVYDGTKETLRLADEVKKDHNIWIQAFSNPRGMEEDIVEATEAAYDAGARTILAWGYYGSISNDYGAKNPYVTWAKTCEAFKRVREFERDKVLANNRKLYMK